MKKHLFFTLFALVGSAPTVALAQNSNLNVQMFRPSPHPYDLWNIQGSMIPPQPVNYGVSLYFVGSGDALVFKSSALAGEPEHRVVKRQIGADVSGALSLGGWVDLGVSFPFLLDNVGDETGDGGFTAAKAPSGTALGDLRAAAKVAIVRAKGDGVGLAVSVDLGIPTGDKTAFTGDEGVTVSPKLIIDYTYKAFSMALNLGYRVRDEVSIAPDLTVDDELLAGFGMQYWFGQRVLALLGEVDVHTQAAAPFGDHNTEGVDLRGGIRWRPGNTVLAIDLAGGASAVRGYGEVNWQAIVGVRIEPLVAPPDTDGDGLTDDIDKCPLQAEDKDGFEDDDGCPEADNDQDGILDGDDACPNDAEDKDGFEDQDGCPDFDNDQDGVPDTSDKCPNEAEDKDGFEDEDGCPEPDNDKDGIMDGVDTCPNDAETANGYQDEDGCPDVLPRVYITKEKVVITEKVFFATNKDVIKSESFSLLLEVARILNENPNLKRVRVEGHTDTDGSAAYNLKLSDRRAASVKKFLVKRGKVGPKRLESKGYGLTRPIGDNAASEGKALNRRVDFVILERTPEAPSTGTPAP